MPRATVSRSSLPNISLTFVGTLYLTIGWDVLQGGKFGNWNAECGIKIARKWNSFHLTGEQTVNFSDLLFTSHFFVLYCKMRYHVKRDSGACVKVRAREDAIPPSAGAAGNFAHKRAEERKGSRMSNSRPPYDGAGDAGQNPQQPGFRRAIIRRRRAMPRMAATRPMMPMVRATRRKRLWAAAIWSAGVCGLSTALWSAGIPAAIRSAGISAAIRSARLSAAVWAGL